MRKLFVIAIIALIAMTAGAQKKISKERIHVSKEVPVLAPRTQSVNSAVYKNKSVARPVAKTVNSGYLELIDVCEDTADDGTIGAATSIVGLDITSTTTIYNGKVMNVCAIDLSGPQFQAYWDGEQLVIPAAQTSTISDYGAGCLYGLIEGGGDIVLDDRTDIIYTRNPRTGKYECNLRGWYIYMMEGEYEGSCWTMSPASTMLVPNGTETGKRAKGSWEEYSNPIFIEDNSDEILIYNFNGCAVINMTVDKETGNLRIPMHQRVASISNSIDNDVYGYWFRLIGCDVTEEGYIVRDENIESKPAYFGAVVDGSLAPSTYNIVTDPTSNGYMGIFSNCDSDGAAYYMGYLHAVNFTLNEGEFKYFGGDGGSSNDGFNPASDDVVDAYIDYSQYSSLDEVPRFSWGGSESAYARLSLQNGCLHFESTEATDPSWDCQWFPIGGIDGEIGTTYTLHYKIKGDHNENVSLLGFGQTPYGQFPITTDWVEGTVDYECTSYDGNLLMQCGSYVGTFDIAYLAITHKGKAPAPVDWQELLVNGDAEHSWAELGLDGISCYDNNNNYKICVWTKEKGVNNINEYGDYDPHPAEIVELAEGGHAFICRATLADTEGDASDWDNQICIESPREWKTGEQFKLSFRYKASQPAYTYTQVHRQTPLNYLYWQGIGDIHFDTEWQTFEQVVTVPADANGMWSVVFCLNPEVKTPVDFYIDDISWSEMVLEHGLFITAANTETGSVDYDYDNATQMVWDPGMDAWKATVGTVGNPGSWVNEVMISTVKGNDRQFKANTIRANSALINGLDNWTDFSEGANARIKLPSQGVYDIYVDLSARVMSVNWLQGDSIREPIELVPNPIEVIVHAKERDWLPADWDGNPQEQGIGEGQPWDNQFIIMANRALKAGETTIIKFKYMGTVDATVNSQCGEFGNPGGYVHWNALGDINFTTEWQEFEKTYTIPDDANGMGAFNFNMAVIKGACDYHVKDVEWYLEDLTESLIDMEGTRNFWVKEGAGAEPYQYGTENPNPSEEDYIVYDNNFEDWTSENHEHNSRNTYSWDLNCTVPGTKLDFDYSVSSESGCDILCVSLDGKELIYVSGEVSSKFSTNIHEAGQHTLVAYYSKDGSVTHGKDEAVVRNITLSCAKLSEEQIAAYVESTMAELQAQCTALAGFDALAEQAQTAISSINTEVTDMDGLEAFNNSVAGVEDLLRQALGVTAEYDSLNELVKNSKELYAVTANAALGTAIAQAEEVIASKAALTIESAGTIAAANKVLSEVLEGIGLNSTKVWDFVISQETIDALNYDSNYYGKWSNNGTYFRNHSSSNDWEQLTYYNQSGQLENVKETEGLYFYQGGYNWYIYVDGTNRIRSNGKGSSYAFMIPDVKAGQEIIIDYKSASEGSVRGISMYSNNLKVIGGYETSADYGVVSYEVTSDGDALFYPLNGGIYINNITLTIAGDPMRLVELRRTVADYLATLDAFPGLQAELQEAYDNAVATEEGADIAAIISNLRNVYDNVQKAVEAYPVILADMEIANAILTEGAYVDISEAVTMGAALDVNTSKSAEYLAAFEALQTSLAIYNADKVDMGDWAFNTGNEVTVDGLNYYLDTTNNLAEFIGFRSSNAFTGHLNIPATLVLDGNTYCVVAVINPWQYTQDNITGVTMPKSLRMIGENAYSYYRNLTYLEIPENVTVIGTNALSNTNKLHAVKLHAVVPPATKGEGLGGTSSKKIYVPAESFHVYRMTSGWNKYILVGGDGVTVSTGKISAGDLGHVVLDDAGYLQEVNKLIIDEGTLNNDDWNAINSMTNLIEIDLSGVTASTIPSNILYNRWAIEKVVLPHNVTTIGGSAFSGTGIKEIILPETLTTLGSYAFSNCDSLLTVSVPASVSNIPYECFYNCDNLQKVELAEGVQTIDYEAFASCNSLSEVKLPSTLTTMGSGVFYNCPIKNIEIPASLSEISSSVFANNNALDSLVIPGTVKTIRDNAFSNNSSLKSVQLNEGVVDIYSNAFNNCRMLEEIILPSTMEKCQNAPFYNCSGIKKIEARSVIPPTTDGSCPLSNVDLTNVTLYVPSWSVGEYQLAEGWSSFYNFETSDYLPENIKVNKDFYFTLRDDVTPDYRPNIYMTYSDVQSTDAYGHYNYERGNLTVSGRSKLAVNNFEMVVSPFAKYYADENVYYGYDYDNYRTSQNSTSLIVNGEMRAEDVTMKLDNYNNRWQFVTFPFDVKVSDIVPQSESTSWVIRGHNGAKRAAGQTDAVWENLTADDVLEAGKGYIMHSYSPNYNNSWFNVSPEKNSVNRQLIFASEDRTIELEENLAEFDHNRSWNLIGNPYPCFYDSRFMDFDAPFMVWNSYTQNYMAFNPADDAYILSPGEAFFVQRPFEQESVTFRKEGRQNNRYAREMEVYAPARYTNANSTRMLYNITLQQDTLADRTRVVINDKAALTYEMSRDAAKFASTDKNMPQIFTTDGKSRYAINERPLANGDVTLGIYCGSEGVYTLSLDKIYDSKVILEDKLMNMFIELTPEDAYTFDAEAGEDLNRFVLHFQGETTGIDEISSDNMNGEGAIYNLQGVKMNNTKANGIYIKNGQKTVIK